jgi:hypothetical protein
MTSGLYGCQVWATSSLTYDSSNITPAHVLHLGFLKRLLSVKKGTDTYCVLSKTGQMPIFFYWFRCIIRFWNSLLSSINPLLEKVVQADLLIANRSDTWTYQVLHAIYGFPTSQQFLNAIRSRESINLKQFELTLCGHIIGSWRELDDLTPHDNHHSSRIMRTYHTHFGIPSGIASGWWNDRIRNHKPVLPIYLRLDISSNPAVHFLAFAYLITFWSKECVIIGLEGLMSSGSVTNVTGTLFRMRNTSCWTVRMNILSASAHSTASWSSHLNMKIAQIV